MQISNAEINSPPYYDSSVIEQLKEYWSHKRKSILLVERGHNAMLKEVHERLRADHDLISAPDCEQCLPLAKRHQPDLLLVSADLLETNDLKLVAALRADAELNPTAILLISEDLEEILALSDRIIVMSKGRLSAASARGTHRTA